MKAVMHCEECGKIIFYDDEWKDFACPHCGEEYEEWTEEDTEMMMEVMKDMLGFWAWHKVLHNSNKTGDKNE